MLWAQAGALRAALISIYGGFITDMKFEDALKKLEKIVNELEEGKLEPGKAMKKYEEGIKLSSLCGKKLEEAKAKLQTLSKTTKWQS